MRRAGSSRPASTTLASNSDGDAEAGAVTSPQKGRGVSRVKQVRRVKQVCTSSIVTLHALRHA